MSDSREALKCLIRVAYQDETLCPMSLKGGVVSIPCCSSPLQLFVAVAAVTVFVGAGAGATTAKLAT